MLIAAMSAFAAQLVGAEAARSARSSTPPSTPSPRSLPRSRCFVFGAAAERDPLTITIYALVGGAAFVAVNFAFISLAISFHQRMPVRPAPQGGAPPRRACVRDPGLPRRARGRAVGDGRTAPRAHGGPAVHRHAVPALVARVPTRDPRRAHGQPHADRQQPRLRARSRDGARAAAENGTKLSLCLVDVDDFKQINDTYGHPLGDQVLVEIARLLGRATDCVGTFRFGGDEFAVVLACGEAKARSHVEALYRRMSARALLPRCRRDGERGRRDVSRTRRRSREPRARRGQRAVLGEAERQEPLLHVQPRDRRGVQPGRARATRRASGAAASSGEPHPRRRCEGRVHGRALGARRAARRGDRAEARASTTSRSSSSSSPGGSTTSGRSRSPTACCRSPAP